jgi:hypothetical protein
MDTIRQGDVMLRKVASLPKDAKEVAPQNGKFVLALGEATGHHHRISADGGVKCFATNDNGVERKFFVIENEAFIEHEEHSEIPLEGGIWEQIYQYETSDSDEPVPVVD